MTPIPTEQTYHDLKTFTLEELYQVRRAYASDLIPSLPMLIAIDSEIKNRKGVKDGDH